MTDTFYINKTPIIFGMPRWVREDLVGLQVRIPKDLKPNEYRFPTSSIAIEHALIQQRGAYYPAREWITEAREKKKIEFFIYIGSLFCSLTPE